MIAILRAGAAALAMLSGAALAQSADFDAAKAFGAREAVEDVSLSPDGTKFAYVAPIGVRGGGVFTVDLVGDQTPRRALAASGDPERIDWCNWASNGRVVCQVRGMLTQINLHDYPITRLIAADPDGANVIMLSRSQSMFDTSIATTGESVIDWLPEENGTILVARVRVPQQLAGGIEKRWGLGVDRIDTRTGKAAPVLAPRPDARSYIGDGYGEVRIAGYSQYVADMPSGVTTYSYRRKGSNYWGDLTYSNWITNAGFIPVHVDRAKDVVYGYQKKDGRWAIYQMTLDGTARLSLLYGRSDVDMKGFLVVGRRARVVGLTYSTDRPQIHYLEPEIEKLAASLSKALPGQPLIRVVDQSLDETKLVILASNDVQPGTYYFYDRQTKRLAKLLDKRPELAALKLAERKAITYRASDGTMVPAFLLIPPGSNGKNLPTIVLPHGGIEARDEWGFDWLPSFFAARGYAVVLPQYRGSGGYGDDWLKENPFKNWGVAVSDTSDAARWLVKEGIADPNRLAIVGQHYGGYLALQSAVTYSDLFKAVVAIGAISDLGEYKSRGSIFNKMVGDGPYVDAGSPARHADKIKASVLLFHAEFDRNVGVSEARLMNSRLASANVPHEFVMFPKLDHGLIDSAVREQMLRKSDEFIRKAMGM